MAFKTACFLLLLSYAAASRLELSQKGTMSVFHGTGLWVHESARAKGQLLGITLAKLQEVPEKGGTGGNLGGMMPYGAETGVCCVVAGVTALVYLGQAYLEYSERETGAMDANKGKSSSSSSSSSRRESLAHADKRYHVLDNAKVMLTFLVVYGHILYYSYTGESDDGKTWLSGTDESIRFAFTAVNSWPVPMFCFLSGILTQGPLTVVRLQRFLQFLVLPAFLWILIAKGVMLGFLVDPQLDTLVSAFRALLSLQPFEVRGYEWFLVTLVLWKASAFLIWCHLRPGVVIAFAMGLSACLGYLSLGVFDNFVALLPYFAAGFAFPLEQALKSTSKLCYCGSGMIGVVVIMWLFLQEPFFKDPLPDGYGSYHCCRAGSVFEASSEWDYKLYWTRKVAKVSIDLIVVKSILLFLVPRCETPLTWVGQYCIYPYLFQGVGLIWREKLIHTFPPPVMTSSAGHMMVLLLQVPYAVFVLVLFASSVWRKLFSWCFAPIWFNLFLLRAPFTPQGKEAMPEVKVPPMFEPYSDSDDEEDA